MISTVKTIAYYAPTKGRRYFSKSAAIKAEARAIILKRYPNENFERDTGHSFDMRINEPEKYEVMFRRMCRIVKNATDGE